MLLRLCLCNKCSYFQVTLYLQGLFLFSLVWSVGATLAGDSRKKFDQFFRNVINGTNDDYPKPKSIKITKVSLLLLQSWIKISALHFTCNTV